MAKSPYRLSEEEIKKELDACKAKLVATKVVTKKDFVLSKSAKRILSTLVGQEKTMFRKAFIQGELSASSNERMTMMYDISPDGKRKKRVEKSDLNA